MTQLSGTAETGWTVEWHANLNDTTGTGQTTGDRYVGTGADSGTVTLPPGPPVRSAFLEPSFTLLPPGPPVHPPSPIRLAVHVEYDETGHVCNVDVHGMDSPSGALD